MSSESEAPAQTDDGDGDAQVSETFQKIVWGGSFAATVAAAGVAFMTFKEEKKIITTRNLYKDGQGTIKSGSEPFTHKDLELIRPLMGSQPVTASFFKDDFMNVTPGENVEWTNDGVSNAYVYLSAASVAFISVSMLANKKYSGKAFYAWWHLIISLLLLLVAIVFFIMTKSGNSSKSSRKSFAIAIGIVSVLIAVPTIIAVLIVLSAFFDGTSGTGFMMM